MVVLESSVPSGGSPGNAGRLISVLARIFCPTHGFLPPAGGESTCPPPYPDKTAQKSVTHVG